MTPCSRDGCGKNRACCRPDCPIVMIEAGGGGWYWETREEVRRGGAGADNAYRPRLVIRIPRGPKARVFFSPSISI
jgi:hypothetical protein